jgi:tripartite-type tricarboxylate transporter receptor subunit TctC
VRTLGWQVLFVFLVVQGIAIADTYPNKPINLVVGFSPGGAADQRSRQIAEQLTKALGQPVVVLNRPGASGAISASSVAKAAPDGYTLLWGSIQDLAINPAINHGLDYDPARDFSPIAQLVSSFLVLSARPGLGVKSVKDLVALAHSKPGQLSGGTAGNGTAHHVALAILKKHYANLDITAVPYKGESPIIPDLLGNHIDIGFSVTTTALPYIQSAKLVPLVVTSPKRLVPLSQVPTAAELGIPELEMTLWGGIVAPAKTPAPIIRRLHAELVKIINSPEIRESWIGGGALPVTSSPEEFAAFIKSEMHRWAGLIKELDLKLE